jgi:hypothetical protein
MVLFENMSGMQFSKMDKVRKIVIVGTLGIEWVDNICKKSK